MVFRLFVSFFILLSCTQELPGIHGTTSLAVRITVPAATGSEIIRLSDSAHMISLEIDAIDAQGQRDLTFFAPIHTYVHFLGSLTPAYDKRVPLHSFPVERGSGKTQFELPPIVLGPTRLWVEDGRTQNGTFAVGTSPLLWFRDPSLNDISRPTNENDLAALAHSPLEGKQVRVTGSRQGAAGKLVVTGVYAQGYTLSDVDCSLNPCHVQPYGHIYVFTFNRPRATNGTPVRVGHLIRSVAGGVSEFNGLTELGFPETELQEVAPELRWLPEPILLQREWLETTEKMIALEQLESALVKVENARICPLDRDYELRGQWKLDVGFGCNKQVYQVATTGTASGFSPASLVGKSLKVVIGTLRPVNIGNLNVWIIYPRSEEDIKE